MGRKSNHLIERVYAHLSKKWLAKVRTFDISGVKGIVSKLTIKFWMCQKCGKMKDYNYKMTTRAVE
jgi:hypothetical protein